MIKAPACKISVETRDMSLPFILTFLSSRMVRIAYHELQLNSVYSSCLFLSLLLHKAAHFI